MTKKWRREMRGWKDDEMTKKWRKKRYDDRHSTWQVTMKWRRKLWRHLWEMIKWVIIFSSLFIISSSIVMMKWRRKSVDFKEIVQNDVELLSNLGLFCVELRAFVRIWCSIEEKDAVLRVFFTFTHKWRILLSSGVRDDYPLILNLKMIRRWRRHFEMINPSSQRW